MPKANNKRKRDNTTTDTKTTSSTSQDQEEEKEEKPMAPAQDANNDNKKEGNDLEGRDFYEVLGISRDATPKEITIAYRKLATKIHPDKNREDPFAKDKFQTLGRIHMTLSDPEKRKVYDQTGKTSDDTTTSGEADWRAYFDLIYKRVDKKDIREFGKQYRGSDEEQNTVLEAYTKFKGNLRKVLEVVMMSREEDLKRFATYCQEAIDAGEVQDYVAFKKFQKYVGDTEIKEDEPEEDELPKDLVASFAQRKSAFDDITARLAAKYGGGDDGEDGAAKKKKKTPVSRTRKGVAIKKKKVGAQKKKAKVVEEDDEMESGEGEEMEA